MSFTVNRLSGNRIRSAADLVMAATEGRDLVEDAIDGESVSRVRIAHFAGSTATIMCSPPLITSNKARQKYGLPLLRRPDGEVQRFDVLRPQRLAKAVTVYVEQYSAHPLEFDAADCYAPPDGFLDSSGVFRAERLSWADVPVYEITLTPEDGLYPLPYMARQLNGEAWDGDGTIKEADADHTRQAFYPDGSRVFEEIDRFGIGSDGVGNLISNVADVDFHRVLPPGGFTKGIGFDSPVGRSQEGQGSEPEIRGRDFFPYRPPHLASSPPRISLARVVNQIQSAFDSGGYDGGIWTQGSPRIEETGYWLNLLLNINKPLCVNAAQREHGRISNDGPSNIVDSARYIESMVWSDEAGLDTMGVVVIQEGQIFTAREVQKADARPGGWIVTGGHGGIVGNMLPVKPIITFIPNRRHTHRSEVNVERLPFSVTGVRISDDGLSSVDVSIKNSLRELRGDAIPNVHIVKESNYDARSFEDEPEREDGVIACIERNLHEFPLSGFVVEGGSPYGSFTSNATESVMRRAVYSGMPVVVVGRGNNEGFAVARPDFIGGGNLTSTKARLLLMAAMMKLGSLPPARDPRRPTAAERGRVANSLRLFQDIFDSH